MKATIQQLFINEFGLSIDNMEVNKPIDVSKYKIGVKAFDEDVNEIGLALVEYAIYKGKHPAYKLKIKNRSNWEEPVACNHLYAIYQNKSDGRVDYAPVEALIKGCKILGEDEYLEVEDIQKLDEFDILDIQTATGNYYSNGILCHNSAMSHLPACTGGKAIRFASSTRQRITKLETLSNGKEDAGIQIRVRNYKNKTGVPWRDAVLNLYFDGGFKVDDEYFGFLALFDIIHKGNGGVYTADFLPNGKIRGEANVKEWITAPEQKELYDKLKEKVMEKLLTKNEKDADNVAVDENGVSETDKVEVTQDDLDLMVDSEENNNPEEVGL